MVYKVVMKNIRDQNQMFKPSAKNSLDLVHTPSIDDHSHTDNIQEEVFSPNYTGENYEALLQNG